MNMEQVKKINLLQSSTFQPGPPLTPWDTGSSREVWRAQTSWLNRLNSFWKSSPQNRGSYGAKDQAFHDTLKRSWHKLKMLIVFYSALEMKLVAHFWKLQPHLPSEANFVLWQKPCCQELSTKMWTIITYVNSPDALLQLFRKKMVFETKP